VIRSGQLVSASPGKLAYARRIIRKPTNQVKRFRKEKLASAGIFPTTCSDLERAGARPVEWSVRDSAKFFSVQAQFGWQ